MNSYDQVLRDHGFSQFGEGQYTRKGHQVYLDGDNWEHMMKGDVVQSGSGSDKLHDYLLAQVRESSEDLICTTCGVDMSNARHWSDKQSETSPDKCQLCAHDDEEKPLVPLMTRAKQWLKMESHEFAQGRGYEPEDKPHDNLYFKVKKPFSVMVQQGSRPSNEYFGSSQIHKAVHVPVKVGPGDEIHRYPGEAWFLHKKSGTIHRVTAKTDSDWDAQHSSFEKRYGFRPSSPIPSPAHVLSIHQSQARKYDHSKLREAGIEESMDTFNQYTEAYGGREVPHPFFGGKKNASVTKSHVPLVWENMLGTVYARSPQGKTEYFDYDWDAAHKHAGVSNASDLRITKFDRNKHRGGVEGPRHKQLVLWGVHPTAATESIRRSIIQQVTEAVKEKKPYNPPPDGPKDVNPFEIHKYFTGMADWHEKEARKHEKLGSFRPLFSSDRGHHTRRSQYHLQMQQAFAQKSLDALNFHQQPDKPGVREALQGMLDEMTQLSEGKDDSNPPRVSPETHIRSMKGEPIPPSDPPEDVDPLDWNRLMKSRKTEATDRPFDVASLKASHPKTFKHLIDRSREASANTGEPDGEYGTLHHIKSLPPSKQRAALDNSLVYHTATSLGPDMDYDLAHKLTAKVRKSVPGGDVLGAFEKGELAKHVEPHLGPSSDKYRHSADKYW